MSDLKLVYMKGNGVGKTRKSQYVDYLISQGVDIEIIEISGEIRGMSCDYIIVDELAKEIDYE